jgi:hypothetical protein
MIQNILPAILLLITTVVHAQKINRQALVQRHSVKVSKADSLSSLTVGNGKFAFTVDVTGLQSFPLQYAKGVSLGTQSEWGWHSFPNTAGHKAEDALRTYHLNGRDITYRVQWNAPETNKAASNWFRQNPHRLQLGNIGFEILKKDGSKAGLEDIRNISQVLNMWTGEITSDFSIENIPVQVSTFGHHTKDAISVRVRSELVKEGRISVNLVFPYPTGEWTDYGINYNSSDRHHSGIVMKHDEGAVVSHVLDSTNYYVGLSWKGKGDIEASANHRFVFKPNPGQSGFEFNARFAAVMDFNSLPGYAETKQSSISGWKAYWNSGGTIDLSGSKDPRAHELERRIILSQYLIRAQETGAFPPQETGLTYNSWFGKPHLEMHWWHAAHFAMWGRPALLEKSLGWYAKVASKGKDIAKRQGFDGIRWQKMTDNTGDETPSSVGAFLIWQQPHFIYFTELVYRNKRSAATLNKYKDLVFATADFMASFPFYEKDKDRYILGKGLIPAQERFKPEECFNPTYELVYWNWALNTAQQWRERLKLPRKKEWDLVLQKLAKLPVQDGKYLFTENATDSYSNPEYRTDHPAVLGAMGFLPQTKQIDLATMKNTFNWIWSNWTWRDTWGWDFPLTAMTATRLGIPDKAIDGLMMNIQTNTYLSNGHNYQDERLRIYLPGNGGLLAAVALMAAGYDGSKLTPGFPKDGNWKVKWEGLQKLP